MKKISSLFIFMLLIYLGISTIFMDFHFVGKFGAILGKYNREIFGYFSYIYPFLLLLPLWLAYKKNLTAKELGNFFLAILLIFLALLLLQALLFTPPHNGKLANSFINMLSPYIGIAGVWLFWFMLVGVIYLLFSNRLKALLNANVKKEKLIIDENNNAVIIKEKIEQEIQETSETVAEKNEVKSHKEEKKSSIKLVKNPLESNISSKPTKKQNRNINITKKEKKSPSTLINGIQKDKERPLQDKNIKKENKKIQEVKIVKTLEENEKLLASIEKGAIDKPENFQLPPIEYLQSPPKEKQEINEAEIDSKVTELISKLKQFKIEGDVVRTYSGPLVTTFEFKPAPHIKVSKILNLADDLAMALRAQTIRIQAPVPGKDVVGIEIPNSEFETIYLREIIDSDIFKKAASPLTLALGKDIVGKPFITDLKKLPHLLIAGTTGSGKSVGINSMLISLLYRNSPDRLKLLMIDPKMLEFSIYNDIPHLLTPVITSSKQAVVALSNMVAEMERRYQLMSQLKTKNIEGYNKKASKEGLPELPYIVVIIDELADLMMTSGKDVEYSIARLAQMARASGIHLIVATQRPSVDVVTGLIKANLPARISFRVGQKIDSKVILDSIGAESLLGRGDMLFTPPGAAGIIRLHAPWVSEQEIEQIVDFLKAQREPEYEERFLAETLESSSTSTTNASGEELDELYEEAKEIILTERKTSISYLQRRLQIGYNRAARIIEQLENMGVLSAPNVKGSREILL
ncbi:DNA translocase FtsK [Nitratiruptor tergarcus]|uniref:DNA segregation ATPase FtsK/SpoIIIE, S-DNA-T family n=1 Tax=Nitratiruptor tergarcus DSM 16512 TaxID=1069081 RepID=A0A1W1WV49_9BACT|nr:DNA translocase FtsK [Nitratiruptor tergarcus]SMC09603.1 DNA segregation ATPase FtsK/SpoIIIE, S-DNA-T family [Nitratiruptor tergarcus DSM 16512]